MPYLALSALTCGVADHLDTRWPATTRTPAFVLSKRAATHASVAVNVAEIDVSFTGIDEVGYEGVGFAERLGGYELVEAELTSVGSALPVNPSGGKGHPSGETSVAHRADLSAQLRGEAVNLVDGARVALTGDINGPTAVSAVTLLEGPANGAR
jgi:acetyl-CoA C-acetyltransferase